MSDRILEALRAGKKRKHKYAAKPTNGYASKAESRYADLLRIRKQAGDILEWLEQVPIRLPGGIKYVCDFMVINRDGSVRFVEVKGFATQAFKMKMRLLAESRPEVFARLEVVK